MTRARTRAVSSRSVTRRMFMGVVAGGATVLARPARPRAARASGAATSEPAVEIV